VLHVYIYIYIYDISSLRVNDLTLILLTWRKWWTPNNASKWQMGFNSAFKGLNRTSWSCTSISSSWNMESLSFKKEGFTTVQAWDCVLCCSAQRSAALANSVPWHPTPAPAPLRLNQFARVGGVWNPHCHCVTTETWNPIKCTPSFFKLQYPPSGVGYKSHFWGR